MLQIDDQNSNVTKTRTSRPQVTETFVTRCINNQQTRHVDIHWIKIFTLLDLFNQFLLRKQSSSNLLSNTSSFSLLNVRSSDFIQKSSLTSIDMTQNAANRISKLSFLPSEINSVVFEQLGLFLFFLLLIENMLNLLLGNINIFFFFLFIDILLIQFQLFALLLVLCFILGLYINPFFFVLLNLFFNLLLLPLLLLLLQSLTLLLLFTQSLLLHLKLFLQTLLLLLEFLLLLLLFLSQQSCASQLRLFLTLSFTLTILFNSRLLLFHFNLLFNTLLGQLGCFFLFFFLFPQFLLLPLGQAFHSWVLLVVLIRIDVHGLLFLFTHLWLLI